MNVVPFPRPQAAPEPMAFTIGARVDLRVGALAAGVVRPRGASAETFAYSNLTRLLRAARMTWRERGAYAGLALAIVPAAGELDPELLSEAAIEAGCTRPLFNFELDERQLAASDQALAEALKARGWGIILRADPACLLPLGARARALYNEITLEAPAADNPYLAIDGDPSPLGQRILAAKAAGMIVTAEAVHSAAQARKLAMAGFDRGGGAFAEANLR